MCENEVEVASDRSDGNYFIFTIAGENSVIKKAFSPVLKQISHGWCQLLFQ